MGTCTGTAFRGRSAHQDVDLAALRARRRPMPSPGARTQARGRRWPGGVGPVRVRHVVALSPGRAAGPGPVGGVRDGLGVAPPRPGAPTRTAAEATVSNDTSTLSCGFCRCTWNTPFREWTTAARSGRSVERRLVAAVGLPAAPKASWRGPRPGRGGPGRGGPGRGGPGRGARAGLRRLRGPAARRAARLAAVRAAEAAARAAGGPHRIAVSFSGGRPTPAHAE